MSLHKDFGKEIREERFGLKKKNLSQKIKKKLLPITTASLFGAIGLLSYGESAYFDYTQDCMEYVSDYMNVEDDEKMLSFKQYGEKETGTFNKENFENRVSDLEFNRGQLYSLQVEVPRFNNLFPKRIVRAKSSTNCFE